MKLIEQITYTDIHIGHLMIFKDKEKIYTYLIDSGNLHLWNIFDNYKLYSKLYNVKGKGKYVVNKRVKYETS